MVTRWGLDAGQVPMATTSEVFLGHSVARQQNIRGGWQIIDAECWLTDEA